LRRLQSQLRAAEEAMRRQGNPKDKDKEKEASGAAPPLPNGPGSGERPTPDT
jgi:hypothetical protein